MLETVSLETRMNDLGRAARAAGHALATAPHAARAEAIRAAAQGLRGRRDALLEANRADCAAAAEAGRPAAFVERLRLDPGRIEAMAAGLDAIAERPDPVGAVDQRFERPNGLEIARVRVPLGVIAVIFESRPNVAADAAGLCLKSGNAAILRGGSDSRGSVEIIHAAVTDGLAAAGLPAAAVQLVPTQDRDAVGHLLGMTEWIDVVVPRGGKSLVERVAADSRVPVLAHLMGLNHSYVHAGADPEMARDIVVNAKMRRPGICGATETLLIDRAVLASHLPAIAADLKSAGCALRGDADARAAAKGIDAACEGDYDTEWLDAVLSIKTVDGLDDALAHIARHGSGHTEAIVTEDAGAAERFLAEVDAAIVMHNASTQYADGGEFGFGAEIGIATGKLHARGPVGAEHLTSYKYRVAGSGQCRP